MAPVTKGTEAEVPLKSMLAPSSHAAVTAVPGATIERAADVLENGAALPVASMEPTEMTPG